jgi:hypothetical protein
MPRLYPAKSTLRADYTDAKIRERLVVPQPGDVEKFRVPNVFNVFHLSTFRHLNRLKVGEKAKQLDMLAG